MKDRMSRRRKGLKRMRREHAGGRGTRNQSAHCSAPAVEFNGGFSMCSDDFFSVPLSNADAMAAACIPASH